jgi:hypothetical protein
MAKSFKDLKLDDRICIGNNHDIEIVGTIIAISKGGSTIHVQDDAGCMHIVCEAISK